MKIIKMLEDIAELDFKIARIKSGTDKQTSEKSKELVNNFLKIFNSEDFASQMTNIITK